MHLFDDPHVYSIDDLIQVWLIMIDFFISVSVIFWLPNGI